MSTYTPYQPRPLAFLGISTGRGLRFKTYSILYGEAPLNRAAFAGAWELAEADLPTPAVTAERPGVGIAILHQGRTADYLIVSWWDRENELPTRVYLRDERGWRRAEGGESFCVWDLRVIWWEREAYVATLLNGQSADLEGYLATVIGGFA